MAYCKGCGKKMRKTSCSLATVFVNGQEHKRIPVGLPDGMKPGGRCDECGSMYGHPHHWGCDQELCPVCGLRLQSCFCEDVYFFGVKEPKPTQKELRKEFAWISLDAELWEISLVTKELVFCRSLVENDGKGMVLVYSKETKNLCISQTDGWVRYYRTLYDVIIMGEEPIYISDAAESFLNQVKKEVYENLLKSS